MMGYLIYDVVIEFINYNKSSSLMNLLHHIIGYGSHMSVRLTDSYAGRFYSMLVFIAEGSTPWLHGSWILHQFKFQGKYMNLFAFNLVSCFFLFRYYCHYYY